jgi:hypothetical protein
VEYLLYTTEQMISTNADWRDTMQGYLADHMPFICSTADWQTQSDGVFQIVSGLRAGCAEVPTCPQD